MLFLLSLVFDHLVSIVEWYASFLDLNLPLECRLSNKILTFKSRVTTMILLFSVSCFLIPNCGSDPRWRSVILKIGDSLDDIYHMDCLQSLPLHGGRFTEFIANKNVQARRKHHYSPSCLTSLNGANFRDKRSFICMHH